MCHRNRHITPFKSYLLRHVSFTISVQHHLQLDLPSISEPFIISAHNYVHTITQFGTHTTNYERRTHRHSESVACHASGYIIVIIINVCLSYHHRRLPSSMSSSSLVLLVSTSAVGTMAHRTQQIHYSCILFAKFEELTNGKNLFAEFINANEMHARNLLRSARCVFILLRFGPFP